MFFCDNYQIQLARNSIYSRPSDKNVARFHYRPGCNLRASSTVARDGSRGIYGNYQVLKARKRRKRKGKKKTCFAFPSPLSLARSHYSPLRSRTALCRTLKKPAHEAVKLLLGVRCYSSLFNAFFHRL